MLGRIFYFFIFWTLPFSCKQLAQLFLSFKFYFFFPRPPCFDFSSACLTSRSSWSFIDWETISSSELPERRAHSGRSDSDRKWVSVPVVPIWRTFRFKSILHCWQWTQIKDESRTFSYRGSASSCFMLMSHAWYISVALVFEPENTQCRRAVVCDSRLHSSGIIIPK